MSKRMCRVGLFLIAICCLVSGCSVYRPLARPVPRLSVLSPELADLSEQGMDKYLKANVKPKFPVVLAVAKVETPYAEYSSEEHEVNQYALDAPCGEEADGWRTVGRQGGRYYKDLVRQVKFINPGLMTGNPTLKKLRDAAAMMNAPLLLVYIQADKASEGFQDGIYTIGYYSACQAALVDVKTGVILAAADSEAKHEKSVVFGVGSAKEQLAEQVRMETVKGLQKNFARALIEMEH